MTEEHSSLPEAVALPTDPRVINLIGHKYGKLSVISYAGRLKTGHHWNCLCDCGSNRVVYSSDLRKGTTTHCGCVGLFMNLKGHQYGSWTVIEKAEHIGKQVAWSCVCECGTKQDLPAARLRSGKSTHCGCKTLPYMNDLSGRKFGRLKVLGYSRTVNHNTEWNCLCECGNETVVNGCALTTGNTSSCGCLKTDMLKAKRTHGASSENADPKLRRTYNIYSLMKNRCTNPNSQDYPEYAGRGITIAPEWDVFSQFLEDMGIAPDGMSIDRKDNDKGYNKDNCRWASSYQQSQNRRCNVLDAQTVIQLRLLFAEHGCVRTAIKLAGTDASYKACKRAIDRYSWANIA